MFYPLNYGGAVHFLQFSNNALQTRGACAKVAKSFRNAKYEGQNATNYGLFLHKYAANVQ